MNRNIREIDYLFFYIYINKLLSCINIRWRLRLHYTVTNKELRKFMFYIIHQTSLPYFGTKLICVCLMFATWTWDWLFSTRRKMYSSFIFIFIIFLHKLWTMQITFRLLLNVDSNKTCPINFNEKYWVLKMSLITNYSEFMPYTCQKCHVITHSWMLSFKFK